MCLVLWELTTELMILEKMKCITRLEPVHYAIFFFFVVANKAMSSSSIISAFGSKEGTVGSFFLSMKCIGLVTFGA